jgi:molecular chaperone DnaK
MNAEADKKAKEEVEKLNEADTMIFQTEKQLKEYGDKIPAEKKTAIEGALNELKSAHASKDLAKIGTALTALNSAWSAASEDMYKAQQQQGGPQDGAGQQGGGSDGKDNKGGGGNAENVTDVDFEEVK